MFVIIGLVLLAIGLVMLRTGLPRNGQLKEFATSEAYTFGVLVALVFGVTLVLHGLLG